MLNAGFSQDNGQGYAVSPCWLTLETARWNQPEAVYALEASAGDNNWWHLQKGQQKPVESCVCCLLLSDLVALMEIFLL